MAILLGFISESVAKCKGFITERNIMDKLNFENNTLDGEKLQNIQYKGKVVQECTIINTEIEKSDFSSTKFIETVMENVVAIDTNFEDCIFEAEQLECYDNVFKNCNLKGVTVKNISINNSEFCKCNMEKFIFHFSGFGDIIFKDNNMQGIEIEEGAIWGKRMIGNDVRNARLRHGGFNHIEEMSQNDFSNSFVEGFSWDNSKCYSNDFNGCKMSHTVFEKTELINCDFKNVKMSESYFKKCIIENCNMEGVDLIGIEFTNCKFRNIDFTKLTYKNLKFEQCMFEDVEVSEMQRKDFNIM